MNIFLTLLLAMGNIAVWWGPWRSFPLDPPPCLYLTVVGPRMGLNVSYVSTKTINKDYDTMEWSNNMWNNMALSKYPKKDN